MKSKIIDNKENNIIQKLRPRYEYKNYYMAAYNYIFKFDYDDYFEEWDDSNDDDERGYYDSKKEIKDFNESKSNKEGE